LFGLEGPQVCLFIIAILFGIWAIIPWLDRRAYHNKSSPAFSDLAWAAILFLLYLTLMGWDIGSGATADDPGALRRIARICAGWTLAAGAFVVIVRMLRFRHRWFILTGATLLHVILHGLLGWPYLVAGSISVGLALIAIVCAWVMSSRERGSPA
jgi:hypothetical protein